jgi:hypothetical protein
MPCIEESGGHDLALYYPSFGLVAPPHGSKAVRAWKGRITPFSDNSQLGEIVQDLDKHAKVDVDVEGLLRHHDACRVRHTALPYMSRLIKMRTTFQVLVLEFEGKRHRQAYCLEPEISSRIFPSHPHLRRDQMALADRPVDAICPYRADETRSPDLVTYLDYVSIFLAKHLVWVRTLELRRCSGDAPPTTIYVPRPNAADFTPPLATRDALGYPLAPWLGSTASVRDLVNAAADRKHFLAWEGTWVGPAASHDPAVIVETVRASGDCVCGSGRRYGTCCRSVHVEAIRAGRRH